MRLFAALHEKPETQMRMSVINRNASGYFECKVKVETSYI